MAKKIKRIKKKIKKARVESRKSIPSKYAHLHPIDRYLDMVVIVAVISGLFVFLLDRITTLSPTFVISIDLLILGVLITDLGRGFYISKSFSQFMKHHWFDIMLVMVFIISFSSIVFAGVGRLSWLVREARLFKVFK